MSTTAAIRFAELLTEKFSDTGQTLSVMEGRKFDRVVIESYGNQSVFAFVERETGDLYKASGWKAPAKHKRYNGNELLNMAVEDADPYGSFLYIR